MREKKSPSKNQIYLRTTPELETSFFKREEKRGGKSGIILILAVILFFLFWGSILLIVPYRQFQFNPAWVFSSVSSRFGQLYQFLFGENAAIGITVWQYLAVMLAGGALAACGTIFQGSFRNVLAGPSTMGVMSGGTLGCMLYLLFWADSTVTVTEHWWGDYLQQCCILLGSLGGVLLILLVATAAGGGRLSPSAMIVSGTVFSSLIQSASMVIQYYMILLDPTDTRIDEIQDLMMGSFNNITSGRTVLLMAVPILLCLAGLIAVSGRLNLLSLGEEEALSMGVNVAKYRLLIILLGTVLTAIVVAFCGQIGFMGFMIPLVGRKLAGPDLRRLLPVSVLLGAIMLTVVFDVAYIFGQTDYLNLFTSSLGSIVMLVTLLRRKGGRGDDTFPGRPPARMV